MEEASPLGCPRRIVPDSVNEDPIFGVPTPSSSARTEKVRVSLIMVFRRFRGWSIALLAAGAVASCGPLPSSQQPVQASNPSVTYKYRTDQELLQANQNATTHCGQYQTAPRTANPHEQRGRQQNRGLRMRADRSSRAGADQSQPELYLSDGPGAGAGVADG